ncbi:MAG: DUF2339 domain-containing protein, partial [Bacteroidota bacterium]
LLVLAYFKQWRIVNILAYVLTVIFFGSWVVNHLLYETALPYRNALLFATGFYLLFFGSNVAYNLRTRGTFRALDISLLLSNTALFYAVGMHCFHHLGNGQFQGLFTVSMAILQFAIVLPLYRRKAVDKNLLYLMIGLVLTFLSLAVPVQLKGHVITLFWSVEAVLLLWMFQRTKIPVLRLGTVVVTILTMISLVMDWNQIYGLLRHASAPTELFPLVNRGFVTGMVTAVTLWLTRFLLQRTPIGIDFLDIRASDYRTIIGLLFAGTLFFTGLLELRYQLLQFVADVPTRNVVMISYLLAFLLGAMGYESRHANPALRSVLTVFGGILLVLFPLINWEMVLVRNHFILDQGATLAGFLYHYVVLALIVTIGWVTLQRMPAILDPKSNPRKPGLWVAVLAALYLLSAELDHLVVWGLAGADNLSYVLRQNHKIGFPILWGISSFALMVYGMRHHWRSLRIISLTLFLVTLIKLFAVDLKGISEAGKIASFVSLGLL